MFWRYLKWSLGFWFGMVWSIAGVLLTVVSLVTWNRYLGSRGDFYAERGTIVDKTHHGRARDPYLTVGYLTRGGKPEQADVQVSRADFERYSLGGQVDLYVAGKDPTDAWLQTDGPRSAILPWIVSGLAVIFGVPGAIVFARSFARAAARARTFASGQRTAATVVAVENSGWTINNTRWPFYRVRWTGVDGQEHQATSLPFHPAKVAYDAGDPITVYVDPGDPSSGEPDPDRLRE